MSRPIYVASRVRHAPLFREARANGVPIISSWIDEDQPGQTLDFALLWQNTQMQVGMAERLVFYAQQGDDPWKGAFVEVGMALAFYIPVYAVLDPDLVLDGRTLRPVGSWLYHPCVLMAATLHDAFTGSPNCQRFQPS